MTTDYGREMRDRAAAMTGAELRYAVDRLLEQTGREETNPDEDRRFLTVREIGWLLGVGSESALNDVRKAVGL